MIALSGILGKIPAPQGRKVLANGAAYTGDIIREIARADKMHGNQTAALARTLRTGNRYKDAQAVHAWIRNNIQYKEDPAGVQLIPSPAQVIHQGFSDCKGMSLLANNILKSMGHPCAYRFVKYAASPSPDQYTHVFAQVTDEKGSGYYFLDPTISTFNYDDTGEYSGKPRIVQAQPFTTAPIMINGKAFNYPNLFTV
jgi:transglutaminase-like putative cysteine protease